MYALHCTKNKIIFYTNSVSEGNQLFQSKEQVLLAMQAYDYEKLEAILKSKDYGNLTTCEIVVLHCAVTACNNDILDILCTQDDNKYGAVDHKLSLLFSSIVYLRHNDLEKILFENGIDFYNTRSDNASLDMNVSSDLKYNNFNELITELLYKAICYNNTEMIDYLLNNLNMHDKGYNIALLLAKRYDKSEMMQHILLHYQNRITNESTDETFKTILKILSDDSKDSSDTLSNMILTDLKQENLPEEVTTTGNGSEEVVV